MKRPVLSASYVSKRSAQTEGSACEKPNRKIISFSVSNDQLLQAYTRCSSLQRDGVVHFKLTDAALFLCTSSKGVTCDARVDLVKRCHLPSVGPIAFAVSFVLLSIIVSKVGRKANIGSAPSVVEFEFPEILATDDGIEVPEVADLWTFGVGSCEISWPVRCCGIQPIATPDGEKTPIDVLTLATNLDALVALDGGKSFGDRSSILISQSLAQGESQARRMICDEKLGALECWLKPAEAGKLTNVLRKLGEGTFMAQSGEQFIIGDATTTCTMYKGGKPSGWKFDIKFDHHLASISVGREDLQRAIHRAFHQSSGSSWVELRLRSSESDLLDIVIQVAGGEAVCTCPAQQVGAEGGSSDATADCQISVAHLPLLLPLFSSSTVVISIHAQIVILEERSDEKVVRTFLPVRKRNAASVSR